MISRNVSLTRVWVILEHGSLIGSKMLEGFCIILEYFAEDRESRP
jgi:hypothetical protein